MISLHKSNPVRIITATAFFLLFSLLALPGGPVRAEELTLDQALEWGYTHSPALQKLHDNILTSTKKLEQIKANLSWQLDLQGTTSYGKVGPVGFGGSDDPKGQLDLAVVGSKSFLWGLNLQPKVTFQEKDEFKFDNLDEKVNFNLTVTQSIFPRVATQLEQEYYALDVNLQKQYNNFRWQKEQKTIDWLEKYLTLLGLQEQVEIEAKNLTSAQTTLANVLKEEQLGEAGKQRVLEAQINEKRAQYRTLQAEQAFQQQKQIWYQELGLLQNTEVILTAGSAFLKQLVAQVEAYNLNETAKPASNPDLMANRLDLAHKSQQQLWSKNKALPQFNFRGNYDYQSENWSVGLNVTYDLLDGGARRLEKQDLQEQLNILESDYQRLLKEQQLKLESYLNQYNLDKLAYEEKSLSLEKAALEESLAAQQYKAGIITEKDYTLRITAKMQAERDLKASRDKVLISKLRLLQFLGLANEFLGGKKN